MKAKSGIIAARSCSTYTMLLYVCFDNESEDAGMRDGVGWDKNDTNADCYTTFVFRFDNA